VTFTLSVPLTLTMIEGLVISCAGQRLVVPLDVVRSLVRPQPDQLTRLPGGGEVLRLPEAAVPLVRLNQVLGLSPRALGKPRIIVVTTAPSGLLGLCADEVMAQEPVLLKGFHRALRMGAGVLAAALISDGSIALVLDIAALDEVVTRAAPAATFAKSQAGALMRK
jgi:two-component system chemotaxis sensor kinase CheA